jgi:hypothetical protein
VCCYSVTDVFIGDKRIVEHLFLMSGDAEVIAAKVKEGLEKIAAALG